MRFNWGKLSALQWNRTGQTNLANNSDLSPMSKSSDESNPPWIQYLYKFRRDECSDCRQRFSPSDHLESTQLNRWLNLKSKYGSYDEARTMRLTWGLLLTLTMKLNWTVSPWLRFMSVTQGQSFWWRKQSVPGCITCTASDEIKPYPVSALTACFTVPV